MNEEEKKAVEFIRDLIVWDVRQYLCPNKEECKNLEIILNLIEKQQKKIENLLQDYKQDEKIIQEMAEFIYGNDTIFYLPKDVNTEKEVIDYFRKRCKQ